MGRSTANRDIDSLGTNISVKLPDGQSLSLTLHKHDQMSKIYTMVSAESGAKEHLVRIKFTGKVLKKTQTAAGLGIVDGMVLKAEILTEREIELTLDIEGHEPITKSVMNTNTVSDLIKCTELSTALQNSRPRIYVGTREITDHGTVLHDAKIGNKTTLVVKLVENNQKNTGTPVSTDGINVEELPAFCADGKTVEVVFSFDTTGSMYNVLTEVRNHLRDLIDRLLRDIPNIRIGLIAQGDYCDYDTYVVKSHDLSNDAESLKKFAVNVPRTGGGANGGEAYEWALRRAQELDWSEESAKALVVIGDEEPHKPSYTDQNLYWHTELDVLCGMGVKVYGVQANNRSDTTAFYKELADRTNGAYVKLSNFSVINDMFLAVCYNESSEKNLDDFMTNLQSEGGAMSEQKKEIFDQLKDQQQAVREDRAADIVDLQIAFDPRQSQNYVSTPWFDRSLDKGTPEWSYDTKKNKWGPKHRSLVSILQPTSTPRKSRLGFLNCFRSRSSN